MRKKIRRFASGAVRSDDTGRIRPDFISPYFEAELAEHFSNNENDFGATNYYKGIKPIDCLPSINRHHIDLKVAIMENDLRAVRIELRALAANCCIALHQIVLEEKGLYQEPYKITKLIDQENGSII